MIPPAQQVIINAILSAPIGPSADLVAALVLAALDEAGYTVSADAMQPYELSDRETRLKCLEISNGDLEEAKTAYEWIAS